MRSPSSSTWLTIRTESAAAVAALVAFAGDPAADAAIRRAAAHPSIIVRVALERSRAEHREG